MHIYYQVNVDTGTRRPVMRTPILKTKSKESDKKSSSKAEADNKPASKAEEDKTPDDKVALESGKYCLVMLLY